MAKQYDWGNWDSGETAYTPEEWDAIRHPEIPVKKTQNGYQVQPEAPKKDMSDNDYFDNIKLEAPKKMWKPERPDALSDALEERAAKQIGGAKAETQKTNNNKTREVNRISSNKRKRAVSLKPQTSRQLVKPNRNSNSNPKRQMPVVGTGRGPVTKTFIPDSEYLQYERLLGKKNKSRDDFYRIIDFEKKYGASTAIQDKRESKRKQRRNYYDNKLLEDINKRWYYPKFRKQDIYDSMSAYNNPYLTKEERARRIKYYKSTK